MLAPKVPSAVSATRSTIATQSAEAVPVEPRSTSIATPTINLQVPSSSHPNPLTSPAHSATQSVSPAPTVLQLQQARLFHVATNTAIELPPHLAIIRLGKHSDRISPDIDVSGFPNAQVVSRSHASIRVEGDNYYLQDMGSSNGTYLNNHPLLPGNWYKLRPGDSISLGKAQVVKFLFQLA
ncbi:MAG: FHA domain-containing protein [Myxacorys chilensis ATA2-1-KO14]|nr:FHA domain-containing protein [Myxacorys chilensis ATA2-1-KO14]